MASLLSALYRESGPQLAKPPSVPLLDVAFCRPLSTPLKRLRKLHITPFFPVDSIVDTMNNLCASPIETVSVDCVEDDVVDVCSAIEHFLNLRVERGPEFYPNLTEIELSVAANNPSAMELEDAPSCANATMRLQELCDDLRLGPHSHYATPPPELQIPSLHGGACMKGSYQVTGRRSGYKTVGLQQ